MWEVMAAVVSVVTGAVTSALLGNSIPAVLKKRKYGRNLKKKMDTLGKRVEELNRRAIDVKELRKRNISSGRMVKNEVEHWLSCVKIINEEVQVVEKLRSVISRRFLAKAWLGKTVLGKIDEVEKLCHQQGEFSGDIGIDRPSTSDAKLPSSAEEKKSKKLKKVRAVMGNLMSAVSRKLKYCRNLKKNKNTLEEGLAELNQLKDDVELRKQKTRLGKMMMKGVEDWLSRVKIINEEVQVVLCSGGSLTKACLEETVLRKIDELKVLCEQGKLLFLPVKESFNKLKQALDRLNSRREEVETLKSGRENAGEVVRKEVNDWLIDVKSINAVIQILEDAFPRVSPRRIHKLNEIVLEKSHAVNILQQRGTSLMEL